MKEIIRQHHISFKNAFSGIKYAFLTQPNFRIHITLGIAVFIMGWLLKLSYSEWIILCFTIFWVISGEMINTAIESLTDLITDEWRKEAKIAKDVAAGMMLMIAVGSILVGGLLFIPKILAVFN